MPDREQQDEFLGALEALGGLPITAEVLARDPVLVAVQRCVASLERLHRLLTGGEVPAVLTSKGRGGSQSE